MTQPKTESRSPKLLVNTLIIVPLGGSNLGRVIPKTQKMVPDASLLNIQDYKVGIQSKWSNPGTELHPPVHLSVVVIEKGALVPPPSTVGQLIYI